MDGIIEKLKQAAEVASWKEIQMRINHDLAKEELALVLRELKKWQPEFKGPAQPD